MTEETGRIKIDPISGNYLEKLTKMLRRFHVFKDTFYLLVRSDHERSPLRAHISLSVHALFHPNIVGGDDIFLLVTQQRKRKGMFFDKFQMTFRTIDANAKQLRFGLDFAPGIAEIASLC